MLAETATGPNKEAKQIRSSRSNKKPVISKMEPLSVSGFEELHCKFILHQEVHVHPLDPVAPVCNTIYPQSPCKPCKWIIIITTSVKNQQYIPQLILRIVVIYMVQELEHQHCERCMPDKFNRDRKHFNPGTHTTCCNKSPESLTQLFPTCHKQNIPRYSSVTKHIFLSFTVTVLSTLDYYILT